MLTETTKPDPQFTIFCDNTQICKIAGLPKLPIHAHISGVTKQPKNKSK